MTQNKVVNMSSLFSGLTLCTLCQVMESQMECEYRGHFGKIWSLRKCSLQQIQAGRDRGCELCTVIVTSMNSFTATVLYNESLAAFRSFDTIEFFQTLNPYGATLRLTQSAKTHKESALFLDLEREELPNQRSLQNGHTMRRWQFTRAMPAELDLPHAISVITEWSKSCAERHLYCAVQEVPSVMPDRILDLSPAPDGSIRLVESLESPAPYIALSYCWGGMRATWSTTSKNLEHQKASITLDSIPTLFRDVVQICQALNICYLWIDSLCVIQDSIDDWEVQAEKMAEIYSSALFTIAASTSRDPSEGLFVLRWTTSGWFRDEEITSSTQSEPAETRHLRQIPASVRADRKKLRFAIGSVRVKQNDHTYLLGLMESHHLVSHHIMSSLSPIDQKKEAPLFARAWAFQERVLSNRMVYFTPSELVWRCRSGTVCECGEINSAENQQAEFHLSTVWGSTPGRAARFERWQILVSQYSLLDLTFESDRLAALSGIAARFSTYSDGQYIAGMWTDLLPAALCWSTKQRKAFSAEQKDATEQAAKPSDTVGAPSWSWASIRLSQGDSISYRYASQITDAECSDFKVVNVEAVQSGKNLYGGVQNATLTVQALCFDCIIKTSDLAFPFEVDGYFESEAFRSFLIDKDCEKESPESYPGIGLPIESDAQSQGEGDMIVMYMGEKKGLILMAQRDATTNATVYRRLGIALLWSGAKDCMDIRQITLV